MRRGLVLLAIAGAVTAAVAAGCEEQTSTQAGDIADADLAVPGDFADEAEKSVTTTNYKAELDALEKEIEAAQ